MINCADIISNCAGPHLEIRRGEVFGAQLPPPIANFGVKMVFICWVSIVLNCAAIFFDRTSFFLRCGHLLIICTIEVNDGSSSA